MNQVRCLNNNMLSTNTYLITNEKFETIIIDPSFNKYEIDNAIKKNKLKVVAILLTHAHFDHIASLEFFHKQYPKAAVYFTEVNERILKDPDQNLSKWASQSQPIDIISLNIDYQTIKSQNTYNISDMAFNVYATPGHSLGCTIFEFDDFIITGDFIFKSTIGRIDLPGSDKKKMDNNLKWFRNKYQSIDKILYPGHGSETNIQVELQDNSYLQ